MQIMIRLARSAVMVAALAAAASSAWASEPDRRDTFGFVIGETTHREAQKILLESGAEPGEDFDAWRGYRGDDMTPDMVDSVIPFSPRAILVEGGYPPFEKVGPLKWAELSFTSDKSGAVLWKIVIRWKGDDVGRIHDKLLAGLKSLYGQGEITSPLGTRFSLEREELGDVEIEIDPIMTTGDGIDLVAVELRYTDSALAKRVKDDRRRTDAAIEKALADSVKDVL